MSNNPSVLRIPVILNKAFEYTRSDIIGISSVVEDDIKRSSEIMSTLTTAMGDDTLSRITGVVEAQSLWDEIVKLSPYTADWLIQAANTWYLISGFNPNTYIAWMRCITTAYSSYQNPIVDDTISDVDTCTFSDELFDSMADMQDLLQTLVGNRWLVFLYTLQPSLTKLIIEYRGMIKK